MENTITNSAPTIKENETTQQTQVCPICKIGHLLATGLVLKGEVDKYMHKCDNLICGHKEMLTTKFE